MLIIYSNICSGLFSTAWFYSIYTEVFWRAFSAHSRKHNIKMLSIIINTILIWAGGGGGWTWGCLYTKHVVYPRVTVFYCIRPLVHLGQGCLLTLSTALQSRRFAWSIFGLRKPKTEFGTFYMLSSSSTTALPCQLLKGEFQMGLLLNHSEGGAGVTKRREGWRRNIQRICKSWICNLRAVCSCAPFTNLIWPCLKHHVMAPRTRAERQSLSQPASYLQPKTNHKTMGWNQKQEHNCKSSSCTLESHSVHL